MDTSTGWVCVQIRENDINHKDQFGDDGGHEWGDECWDEEGDGDSCLVPVVSCCDIGLGIGLW